MRCQGGIRPSAAEALQDGLLEEIFLLVCSGDAGSQTFLAGSNPYPDPISLSQGTLSLQEEAKIIEDEGQKAREEAAINAVQLSQSCDARLIIVIPTPGKPSSSATRKLRTHYTSTFSFATPALFPRMLRTGRWSCLPKKDRNDRAMLLPATR